MRTKQLITTLLIAAASTVAAFCQSIVSPLQERLLFTTDFSDFPNLSANTNCPINIKKTALYTQEKLTIKVIGTQIVAWKPSSAEPHYLKTLADPDAMILVSPVKDITRICFKQSGGGFKVEARGDEDSTWVTLGSYPITPRNNRSSLINVTVNRSHCQLRFTNALKGRRTSLSLLRIFGKVDKTLASHNSATIVYHNMDGDPLFIRRIRLGRAIGTLLSSKAVTIPEGMVFKGWSRSINNDKKVAPSALIKANVDLYPILAPINHKEARFTRQGDYYIAEAGSAESVLAIFKAIAAAPKNKTGQRYNIFLPNGTYHFGNRTELTLPCDNVSVIGQSMDATILVTRPEAYKEGLGTADLFYNTHKNIYFENLTLKNALDHYGHGGRAAVMHDCGTRTIYKNVRMLSYQDTYFSENNNMQSYFDGCDIHGKTDFICGGGDIRFYNTTISLEPRALTTNQGGRIITAPSSTTVYGYVFDHCRIIDLANGEGSWVYGRMWRNKPVCVWLNTTLDENAAKTLTPSRWIEKGMNNTDPKLIGEYATVDEKGRDLTPSSNIILSYDGAHETVLSTSQAEAFQYKKMYKDWDPQALITRYHEDSQRFIKAYLSKINIQ